MAPVDAAPACLMLNSTGMIIRLHRRPGDQCTRDADWPPGTKLTRSDDCGNESAPTRPLGESRRLQVSAGEPAWKLRQELAGMSGRKRDHDARSEHTLEMRVQPRSVTSILPQTALESKSSQAAARSATTRASSETKAHDQT